MTKTRGTSWTFGLLLAYLALLKHGYTEAQSSSSTTQMTPSTTPDNRTTSQLNTTSGRNSTMSPAVTCYNYNDTVSNATCISGTGICYASYSLSSGVTSLSCKSLNSTVAAACKSGTPVTWYGSCEMCCTSNLCNRDKIVPGIKTACCGANQNQPACSSKASRVVMTTHFAGIVTSVVFTMFNLYAESSKHMYSL